MAEKIFVSGKIRLRDVSKTAMLCPKQFHVSLKLSEDGLIDSSLVALNFEHFCQDW